MKNLLDRDNVVITEHDFDNMDRLLEFINDIKSDFT